MVTLATLMRLIHALASPTDAGLARTSISYTDSPPMDEFVTVATFDKLTDAHIALGRLAAEGIHAQLFDEQMVQMESAIAFGGIKLRVARSDEAAARKVLETDYSATLKDVDVGKPE